MKKKIGIFALIFILIFIFSSYYIIINGLPENLSIIKNDESSFDLYLPFNYYIEGQENSNIKINGKNVDDQFIKVNGKEALTLKGEKVGQSCLNLKLFGLIPLRSMQVNVLPEIKVYPGGQAIGVLLRSKGVMVVGVSYVETHQGKKYPARDAGIEVGDIILEVNQKVINSKVKLSHIIQDNASNNSKISLLIKKSSKQKKLIELNPVKNIDGQHLIGLYVDDGVSGVGTLTFYDSKTDEYGALGHVVTESHSQGEIDVREGKIVEAQISGINYGQRGIPGQKQGTFFQYQEDVLGNIYKNNQFGIFGNLEKHPQNPYFNHEIPVAAISQVTRGPAKIYTVIKGGQIQEFDINIDQVLPQSNPDSKGMVINITDPELKKMTGGIIQGMSGSPIVQNNRLVGAVTHVFINNPVKGYGVFAEWMLRETEILKQNFPKKAANY